MGTAEYQGRSLLLPAGGAMENGNILKFQEQFSQDVADLLIAGIEEAEVALMLDQLRYKIEGAI